jgi:hypothetical protein
MVVYIYYVKQLEISSQLAAGQLLLGQPILYEKGRQYGPSPHTCRVTLLQTARQDAVLGQPSSLRPHCADPPSSAVFLYIVTLVLNFV